MASAWSLVRSGAKGVFGAVRFVTTPVWLPAKTALGFVKNHKLLTVGATVGAMTVIPAVKKMNHSGQTVDLGLTNAQPVDDDVGMDY